jgi:hypothetical protein
MIENRATASNYEIHFPLLPGQGSLNNSKDLTLHIFGSVVPGFGLRPIETSWQGAKVFYAGVPDYEDWDVRFIVDEVFTNWQILYSWMTLVANKRDRFSNVDSVYQIDATLRIFDNFQKTVLKLKMIDIWPKHLGSVILTAREGANLLESSVSFQILRFESEPV